jgi:transcriptional regulator with XRE-family HTH domain
VPENPALLFAWLEACRKQPGWGWSQKQLAEACAISANGMRGWRKGSMPDRHTLTAVATGIGVPIEALRKVMRGEQVPPPPAPPGTPVPIADEDPMTRLRRLEERVETLTDLVLRQQNSSRG